MLDTTPRRYGPARTMRSRRGLLAAAVLGGAAVIALLIWMGAGILRTPVRWTDVGFAVEGPAAVTVTFDVVKAPEATVECTIHALNESFAEVGVIRMTAGPALDRAVRHTVMVETQELATTGLVDSCRAVPADAG